MIYKTFKRLFDIIISLIGLIITAPAFLVICAALYLFNNREIFFTQMRPGLQGHIFEILKFKTMNDKKSVDGQLLADAELPQLINVIKGDMSLIGPRPLLVEYLALYNPIQAKRHNVRPGITGWAQINGRNALSWSKKFEYDLWYVENMSFKLDLLIFVLTIKKVFIREGISSEDSITTEKFYGNF
jgi:undecaprenyl phosphate N,N'-diacetylbacillosamine 1-phosphate transferase